MIACSPYELPLEAVLVRTVLDFQGNLLIEAGVRITRTHLRVLKAWGVSEVWIEGVPKTAATDSDSSPTTVQSKPPAPGDSVMATIMAAADRQVDRRNG